MKIVPIGLIALTITCAGDGSAAGYPDKPVRVIAASAAGGGTDFIARTAARRVSEALGQTFVVDNRGGAAGIVGTQLVANAEPDGYTLLIVFANLSTYPSLGKKLGFDIRNDLQPISTLATTALMLVVNNRLPVKSVSELIDLAKTKSLNYAAPGIGSMGHLAAELFNIAVDVRMEHIPYKGGGPAITALIGNEVDLYFSTFPAALAQMKAGRLRGLAVSTASRVPFAPDLPTIAESGLLGYEVNGWYGLFAPAGTSKQVTALLQRTFAKSVRQPAVQQIFALQGVTGVGSSPDQLAGELKRDMEKWATVIRTAKIAFQ